MVKFVIYLNALIDWKHEQFTLVAFGVSLSHSVICRPCVYWSLESGRERGAFVVVPIKFIVGVWHELISPQIYDVRVTTLEYVYT